ncbi:MAG: hypothetical protein KDK34_01320 [Leptospiraceae bacterium]|nr:hypothetical protein [Leptospiraceae bacterium]
MSFSLEIDPEWNVIKKIKQSINSDPEVQGYGNDFREATLLTAIELVENALKYSDSNGQELPVKFSFELKDGVCRIQVNNQVRNAKHRAALKDVLEKIKSEDPFKLYVKRLEALRDQPDGYSRMGLIRIIYEGEFDLNAEFDEETVTLIATRKI